MNLTDIKANLFKKDGDTIDLKKYTILGTGDGFKATIKANKASATALEKMKKAGGSIELPAEKPKEEKQKEEPKPKEESKPKEEAKAKPKAEEKKAE